jgi:hypothetical protein
MSKFAVALSVLALGGSGYTAWKTGVLPCLSGGCSSGGCDRVEADDVATLSARIRVLEDQLALAKAPAPLPAPRGDASADSTGLASAPKPLPTPPSSSGPAPTAEVIAALEKRLATLEESDKGRPHAVEFGAGDGGTMPQIAFHTPKMYGSVADAAKDLDLSPRQKDDFERAVADAKRELEDLKKIPDSDGKTWNDIEKDAMPKPGEGPMSIDIGALMGFPSRKIPGRTETFGQAQRRIQAAAKQRMSDTLTPDQQKKFSKAHVDPMLGGSGGAMISFATSVDLTDDSAMK